MEAWTHLKTPLLLLQKSKSIASQEHPVLGVLMNRTPPSWSVKPICIVFFGGVLSISTMPLRDLISLDPPVWDHLRFGPPVGDHSGAQLAAGVSSSGAFRCNTTATQR